MLPGDAVTVDPVEAVSPVDGLQLYEVAPLAVSTEEDPRQMTADVADKTGRGFTWTITVALPGQP